MAAYLPEVDQAGAPTTADKDVLITALVDLEEAPTEVKTVMEEAYGVLTEAKTLDEAIPTLNDWLNENNRGVKASELVIRDGHFFYMGFTTELAVGETKVVNFKVEGLKKKYLVIVGQFVDGEFILLDANTVEIIKDSELGVTFEIGDTPVIFITNKNESYEVQPTYSFKHLYKNNTLIGTGAYKFRRYSVSEPKNGYTVTIHLAPSDMDAYYDELFINGEQVGYNHSTPFTVSTSGTIKFERIDTSGGGPDRGFTIDIGTSEFGIDIASLFRGDIVNYTPTADVDIYATIAEPMGIPTIITFYIDGSEYTTEEGTTWGDFASSQGWSFEGRTLHMDGFSYTVTLYNSSPVVSDDMIEAGGEYQFNEIIEELKI